MSANQPGLDIAVSTCDTPVTEPIIPKSAPKIPQILQLAHVCVCLGSPSSTITHPARTSSVYTKVTWKIMSVNIRSTTHSCCTCMELGNNAMYHLHKQYIVKPGHVLIVLQHSFLRIHLQVHTVITTSSTCTCTTTKTMVQKLLYLLHLEHQ